jgi:creatinine amidohydrolase
MGFTSWQELSSARIGALDPKRTIALLPLAATEQHGPHLPTGTDSFIAAGLIAEAGQQCPPDVDVVVLPSIAVGASAEHMRYPGTLSISPADLVQAIVSTAEGVGRSGLRKLVLASSHGGNVSAMMSAALECRIRYAMVAATLTFARLGLPPGVVPADEVAFGVHGGLVETALMLHFRPDLVDMKGASLWPSQQEVLTRRFRHLRAHGPIGFGWLAGDLNPSGVTGNAAAATAEIGAAIAAHQAAAFSAFLSELAAAELASLLKED